MSKEIVDFHIHIGSSRAATYEENGESELIKLASNKDLLHSYMCDHGIGKAVVFPLPMMPGREKAANDEVIQMVSGNSNLIPFSYLDPRLSESPDLLQTYVTQGSKGLKLHPVCHGYVVSHSMCYPTIEEANHLNIPVLIHTGWGEYGEIRFIKKLAQDFPHLSIVIAHLIEYQDIFTMIPPFVNVFVETSYSTHPKRIVQAVNLLGSERVIFGSDMPLTTPGFELYKVMQAQVSDLEKDNILFKNASRLIK
jgi:uncharacterized protein